MYSDKRGFFRQLLARSRIGLNYYLPREPEFVITNGLQAVRNLFLPISTTGSGKSRFLASLVMTIPKVASRLSGPINADLSGTCSDHSRVRDNKRKTNRGFTRINADHSLVFQPNVAERRK